MKYQILFLILTLCFTQFNGLAQNYHDQIDQVVENYFNSHCPAFSVLAIKDQNIIFEKVVGAAKSREGEGLQYQFLIASITKQFTAVAIMQLMEKGELALDDDVRTYAPEFLPEGPGVSIRQLLTHTAGLDNQSIISEEIRRKIESQDEMLDYFKDSVLLFEPGAQYRYSNLGYMLLGHVIENISGMTCQQYFQEFLFDPAGMKNSVLISDNRPYQSLVEGFTHARGSVQPAKEVNMFLPFTGGGIASTAMDLFRWYQALEENRIISEESLELCFTENAVDGVPANYGLGWMIGQLRGSKVIKHDGIISGFQSFAAYIPDEDIFVVSLCNCDNVPYLEVPTSKMMAILMNQSFEENAMAMSIADAETLTGKFMNEGKAQYISYQNATLVMHEQGGSKYPLIPQSDGSFVVEGVLDVLTIKKDSESVSGFHLESLNSSSYWSKVGAGKNYGLVNLADKEKDEYVGKYQVPDAFIFEVYRENQRMYGRVGHDAHEISCFEADHFFAHGIDGELHFHRNDDGVIEAMSLVQGREIKAIRMEP